MKNKTKNGKISRHDNFWGLLLASPPIIGFAVFSLIPLLFSLYMSVCSTKGFLVSNMHFLGFSNFFGNFKEVLTDPLFYTALLNTLYSLVALPVTIFLALIVSVLLTKKFIPHKKVFRTIFFLPYVCSIVALTTMWRTAILDKSYGVLNQFLGLFGVPPIAWLTNAKSFMPAMILMGIWMNLGFYTILFSAALTNVNESLYEAASLDGANWYQRFFRITMPMISPTTFYILVTGLIAGLQEFTRFQAINNVSSNLISPTGPDNAGLTIVFYLYNKGFNTTTGMGVAAATSWILCILIGIITFVNFRISDKWVNYD